MSKRDTIYVDVWFEMRIAIIIERTDINLGGAERSVFEMATAISKTGIEVDILAAKGYRDTKNIHILCGDSQSKRTGYFAFAKAIKRYLSKNRYSLIHSVLPFTFADIYQPRGGAYAESILRNAESFQNKFIVSYKKLTAFANFRRSVLLQAERKLCRQPDKPVIIAISQYVAEQFKRHYDVSNERIMVVPNGIKIRTKIDTNRASKLRSQILGQLGITESDKPVFFLFVANNFRLKGLAVLIKAMRLATVRNTPQPVFLIVVGNGKLSKYYRLANEINPSETNKNIIFLGPVSHVQNILSISDIAVLPTFYDPCSRFILEALAAGKPVITTRFNGATDFFVNNLHGRVIDSPEDITALVEAIGYFTDTDNIKKASQAITEDNLREKISINRVAEQLISVYESVLEERR
jgi:UDP-glucose:(heptosyl)LPS alpha-1,3-glucosyltransferase